MFSLAVALYGTIPYNRPMAARTSATRRPTKTTRLDLRAEPERAERIAAAAALSHQSVSAFVLDAAAARAQDVLDRTSVTALDEEHFERLLDALDAPYAPNHALQHAAANR